MNQTADLISEKITVIIGEFNHFSCKMQRIVVMCKWKINGKILGIIGASVHNIQQNTQ